MNVKIHSKICRVGSILVALLAIAAPQYVRAANPQAVRPAAVAVSPKSPSTVLRKVTALAVSSALALSVTGPP